MTRTLIICPTHDHVDTLFAAIASVQAQQDRDWELVVIGDGAPDRSRQIVSAIADWDPRVRYEHHPKGEGFGEAYRGPVIRASNAEYLCHLGDDDIWSSRHLSVMTGMLADADWAMQGELVRLPNGRWNWRFANHGTASARRPGLIGKVRMATGGLNNVAVRREAYLNLEHGWRPAAPGKPSDKSMWVRYLQDPRIRIASSAATTYIKLTGSGPRRKLSPEARLAEIAPLLARVNSPGFLEQARRSASIDFPLLRAMAYSQRPGFPDFARCMESLGLRLSQAGEDSSIALNGAPMSVPVTDAQQKMCRLAWHIYNACYGGTSLRALNELATDVPREFSIYVLEMARHDPNAVISMLDNMEVSERLDLPITKIRLRILFATEDWDAARKVIAEGLVNWPGAEWLRKHRDRIP